MNCCRLLVLSLLLVGHALNGLSAELRQQDIFVGGKDGYHTYRIPSLLVTKKGTLLAFCEGRKGSASDSGDIDILFKRSTDHGKTWSGQQVIWDDSTNTCGNPCAVQDAERGTICLLLTHNLGQDHESQIVHKIAKGTRTVWISRSSDDGKTWSAPSEITTDTKDPAWDWYATGPGIGIQIQHGLHKGRLIVPCDHSENSATNPGKIVSCSHIIYSDDHGQTWKRGGTVQPRMNECQVVELADGNGTLLLSMRNHPGSGHRAESISHDGGITWSDPVDSAVLIDPTCEASILRCTWPKGKQPGRILFSNPADSKRRNMTVRLSYDDAKTWPIGKVLWENPSAYSCLAVWNDEIGCLYERGDSKSTEKITLATFPISWLEKAKP